MSHKILQVGETVMLLNSRRHLGKDAVRGVVKSVDGALVEFIQQPDGRSCLAMRHQVRRCSAVEQASAAR